MKLNKTITLIFIVCFSQFIYGQKDLKVSAKPVTVTGKVSDKNQVPIAGAVIYIDSIKTDVFTKKNGSYKIKVSPSAKSIEARSSDYGNSVTSINGQTHIDFILNVIDVKVSSQGETGKDRQVKENDKKAARTKSKKINTYNDIFQMIRAEVSGVTVTGRSIHIQQRHSFYGSGDPLFLVNGVIVENIAGINPLEVKSIRVLMGSEAVIYGVRGSNGVLSITLKNGNDAEQ
jgi:hypothetical protein